MTEPKSADPFERKFRNRFLIFPKFQMALISMNLVTMFLVCGIVYFQVSRAFNDLRVLGSASGMEADMYNKVLAFHAGTVESYLLSAALLALVVSIALTLVISHRFAGPLVRLRGFFKSLPDCTGPLPRLNFRRGDFLSDIPPVVNNALDAIQARNGANKGDGGGEKPQLRIVGKTGT